MSLPTVFVCGATGIQGGSVARALSARSIPVHGLARDPAAPAAQSIGSLGGARLWEGDYADSKALAGAMAGCTAVFLNLSPDFLDHGAELRHAQAIIAAAQAAGVNHFVYSSGLAVNAPERLKYYDPQSSTAVVLTSKKAIEGEVRAAGFDHYTILRPGNFMANYLAPLANWYAGLVDKGRWSTALERTSVLPMVHTSTIGAFAAAAFLDPERFHKQEVEIVDQLMVVDEILSKLSAATGRDLQAVYLPEEEINVQKVHNPIVAGLLAMRDLDQFADMERVKSWGVPLRTFDHFLEQERRCVMETYQLNV